MLLSEILNKDRAEVEQCPKNSLSLINDINNEIEDNDNVNNKGNNSYSNNN